MLDGLPPIDFHSEGEEEKRRGNPAGKLKILCVYATISYRCGVERPPSNRKTPPLPVRTCTRGSGALHFAKHQRRQSGFCCCRPGVGVFGPCHSLAFSANVVQTGAHECDVNHLAGVTLRLLAEIIPSMRPLALITILGSLQVGEHQNASWPMSTAQISRSCDPRPLFFICSPPRILKASNRYCCRRQNLIPARRLRKSKILLTPHLVDLDAPLGSACALALSVPRARPHQVYLSQPVSRLISHSLISLSFCVAVARNASPPILASSSSPSVPWSINLSGDRDFPALPPNVAAGGELLSDPGPPALRGPVIQFYRSLLWVPLGRNRFGHSPGTPSTSLLPSL